MDRTAQTSGLTFPNSFLALALALCFCSFSFHLIWSPRFFFFPLPKLWLPTVFTFASQIQSTYDENSPRWFWCGTYALNTNLMDETRSVCSLSWSSQLLWSCASKDKYNSRYAEAHTYSQPNINSTSLDVIPWMWFLLGPPRVSVWFGSLKMQRFTRK